MKALKCIEANNEISTVEELSQMVSNFGYEASKMIADLKENPAFQKIELKISFELRTE